MRRQSKPDVAISPARQQDANSAKQQDVLASVQRGGAGAAIGDDWGVKVRRQRRLGEIMLSAEDRVDGDLRKRPPTRAQPFPGSPDSLFCMAISRSATSIEDRVRHFLARTGILVCSMAPNYSLLWPKNSLSASVRRVHGFTAERPARYAGPCGSAPPAHPPLQTHLMGQRLAAHPAPIRCAGASATRQTGNCPGASSASRLRPGGRLPPLRKRRSRPV